MTKWIDEARKHIGLKEIVGKDTNLTIQSWLSKLRAWWRDDETAWCGTYVAHCIKAAGYSLPKHWYRAMDWLNWGVDIGAPCYGCVAILSRKGGGHVMFAVGFDEKGNVLGLGGNQGNAVTIQAFDPKRIVGYRMPVGTFHRAPLPLIRQKFAVSTNEA
jgi:uncharacterized protein (TIGR02594 family)